VVLLLLTVTLPCDGRGMDRSPEQLRRESEAKLANSRQRQKITERAQLRYPELQKAAELAAQSSAAHRAQSITLRRRMRDRK
jgi:hypothetical protein